MEFKPTSGNHVMKTRKTAALFFCGTLFGILLTLCLGAADHGAVPARKDPSPFQIVTYPSGVTGIFDPNAGRIYLYDVNLVNCYTIREITTLGDQMKRVRN
jgi:hypothetical protein